MWKERRRERRMERVYAKIDVEKGDVEKEQGGERGSIDDVDIEMGIDEKEKVVEKEGTKNASIWLRIVAPSGIHFRSSSLLRPFLGRPPPLQLTSPRPRSGYDMRRQTEKENTPPLWNKCGPNFVT